MEIILTPETASVVRRGMASGRYSSPDDLVNAALSAFISGDTRAEKYARDTSAAIEAGWEQSEQGELVSADEVFQELADLSRELRARDAA
jgi:Arc/MetJ-type ribon-helix-helix transcriptional regulator